VPVSHAAACGGIVGILLGAFIALIYGLPINDAAYRLGILTLSGAWMGSILALLNEFLTPGSNAGTGNRQERQ